MARLKGIRAIDRYTAKSEGLLFLPMALILMYLANVTFVHNTYSK